MFPRSGCPPSPRPLPPLPPLLLLLLLTGARLAQASVGDTFGECSQFLYMRTPPAGLPGGGGGGGGSFRRICQRYGDKPRYATLYDRARRLPVYSAYTFKKSDGQRRVDTPWMYEPQLVSEEEGGNMKVLPPDEELDPLLEESQVVLQDFVDATLYQRSTLNPDQHQADDDDKAATYTLTNVVPLLAPFLEESWTPYLDVLRRRLNNFCRGTSYVVTGVAVSGGPTIRRGNTDRLAVPRYLWSAYCCPRFDRNSPYAVRYKFPSHAAYGLNQPPVGAAGAAGGRGGVLEVPLKTLEGLLRNRTDAGPGLALFHRDCVSENAAKKRRRRESVPATP
ncbi:endonuclease domain-containing 1 protein-like [Anguilla rostrata]|uniref:endonuclease domain-containing 1 protein-like n=1 Tax=Anguilla rostrata TaxID=7938 RepID=UPI0030CF539E